MKKLVTILLLLAMTLPVTACNNKQESTSQPESSVQQESSITTESNTAETEQPQTISPTKLTNKMTETELSRVDKHELTLLDVPQEPTTEAEPAQTEHKVSVEFHTPSIDECRENIESYRDQMTNEEYEAAMENIRIAEEKGENGGNPHPSTASVFHRNSTFLNLRISYRLSVTGTRRIRPQCGGSIRRCFANRKRRGRPRQCGFLSAQSPRRDRRCFDL